MPGDITELDLLVAAAVEQDLLDPGGQLSPRLLDIEIVVLCQTLDHGKVVGVAAVPAADGAAREAQFRIPHHAVGVEELLYAEAVAGGAGARGVVEREQPRLQFGDAEAADGARKAVREDRFGPTEARERRLVRDSIGATLATPSASFSPSRRIRRGVLDVVAHLEAVYDHLDMCLRRRSSFGGSSSS